MHSLVTHIQSRLRVFISSGMAILFGIAAFLYMSTGIFLYDDSKNSIAIGIAGIVAIAAIGLIFLRPKYFLQTIGRNDVIVIGTTIFSVIFAYVTTPLSYVSLFGRTFEPTTLIALTAYSCIFFGGYLVTRVNTSIRLLWFLIRTGTSSALVIQIVHLVLNPTVSLFEGVNAFSSALVIGFMMVLSVGAVLSHQKLTKTQIIDFVNIAIFVVALLVVRSDILLITTSLVVLMVISRTYYKERGVKEESPQASSGIGRGILTIGFVTLLVIGIFNSINVIPRSVRPVAQDPRPSIEATVYTGMNSFASQPTQYGIGSGANSFTYVWNNFMPDIAARSRFWDTNFGHGFNFMFTFLIEFGLPTFLLFVILYIVIITIPFHQRGPFSPLYAALAFSFYWLWFVVPGTFFLTIVMFCMGNVLGYTIRTSTQIQAKEVYRKFFFLGSVLFLILGIVLSKYAYTKNKSLYPYRTATNKNSEVTRIERITLLKQSDIIFESPYTLKELAVNQIAKAIELQTSTTGANKDTATLPSIKQILARAKKNAAQSAKLSRNDYKSLTTLSDVRLLSALAEKRTEGIKNALGSYQHIQEVARKRLFPKYVYIRALVAAEQYREAHIKLREFVQEFPQFIYLKDMKKTLESNMVKGK